jgi:hypothetical protein
MPDGLKLAPKTGHILYDSTLIAGVEYIPPKASKTNVKRRSTKRQPFIDDVSDTEDEPMNEEVYDTEDESCKQDTDCSEDSDDDWELYNQEDDDVGDNQPQNQIADYDDTQSIISDRVPKTRSGRSVRPPERLNLYQQHVEPAPYTLQLGRIIANVMHELNAMQSCGLATKHHSFAETFGLKKGLQKFGERGLTAASNEMKQLHQRAVFKPLDVSTLSFDEKRKTMRSLIFLTKKRDGTIKARTCAALNPAYFTVHHCSTNHSKKADILFHLTQAT